jgi:microcystin-dependent protein
MPANTPTANLPYPLLADSPADIEVAIKPLALALDTLVPTALQRAAMTGFGGTAPSDANRYATKADIGAPVPIGAIVPYAGSALPAGGQWLWADGALVSATTYAGLFAICGHAYNGGIDPGGGNFRKPDKRGRVSMGADNFGQGAAGRLPNTTNKTRGLNGGEERHQTTLAETAAHTHVQNAHSHPAPEGSPDAYLVSDDTPQFYDAPRASGVGTQPRSAVSTTGSTTAVNQSAGSGTPHNNLPLYEVDTYIVRVL